MGLRTGGVQPADALDHDPSRAGGGGGLEQVRGAHLAQACVGKEARVVERDARRQREIGQEMDDDLGVRIDDRGPERGGVERVDHDGLPARRPDPPGPRAFACRPDDVMTARDEPPDDSAPQHARPAGDEHVHRVPSSHLRTSYGVARLSASY